MTKEKNDFKKMESIIYFCDIHNFSKICLELDNEGADFIQTYYHTIGESIIKKGGKIIKYMGDCIYALFPYDLIFEVISAAKKCKSEFHNLLKEFNISEPSELEAGIGCGEVICGDFGHPSCRYYDAFGVKVNETAMIMHHRGIAVTEDVYKRIYHEIKLKKLPNKTVKWSQKPLKVWEITSD